MEPKPAIHTNKSDLARSQASEQQSKNPRIPLTKHNPSIPSFDHFKDVLVSETEPFKGSECVVGDEDVGVLDQFLQLFFFLRFREIEEYREFTGVV
jgi:hypothetical protein